jgi:MraZ protein
VLDLNTVFSYIPICAHNIPYLDYNFPYGQRGVEVALFLSTYVNKVDKKGRVSVPAQFRASLTGQNFNGIVIYPSFVNNCIESSGMDRIEKLSESIDNLDPFSEERDAFATSILANCIQLSFDSEGRVTLPEGLTKDAGIKDKVVFVGKGVTFEIWNPADFEKYAIKAKEVARSQRKKLQLNRGGGAT